MRAVQIHAPRLFRTDVIEDPTVGADDVLVEVKACGLCGSDLAYIDAGKAGFSRAKAPPAPIGHEAAGVVLSVGTNIRDFAPGDRVAINPIDTTTGISIGNGAPEGAFAEVLNVRNAAQKGRLLELPAGLDYEIAALAEPMSVALHTVKRSGATSDSKVVVVGAGPIGLGVIIWLKQRNVRSVVAVDLSAQRLDRARSFGADGVIQSGVEDLKARLRALQGRAADGAPDTDIFVDAAGSAPALSELIRIAKSGAAITVVAVYKIPVKLDLGTLLLKEMSLTTAVGYPAEFESTIEFLAKNRHQMRNYISDRFPLDQFDRAVARARTPQSGKVMICMDD